MGKTDEDVKKITGETKGKRFSITGIQRVNVKDEGDLIQFYIDASDIAEAYKIGKERVIAILNTNSIVRAGEVID